MRYTRQHQSLKVDNSDIKTCVGSGYNAAVPSIRRHGILLPNSIRCLIVGPSNCGKTNVMVTLLEHVNGLKFENVYIYSKSLYQPKYEYLKRLLTLVHGIGFYTFSNNSEVIPPEEAKPNSVFIFDDVACDKQDNIRAYFSMGRHCAIDSFYINQTYTRIPKHLIRDNANLLIIFKQDVMNIKHIYNNHVGSDMTFARFLKLCSKCWRNNKYGFLVVDTDSPIDAGRYRKGFDIFIQI